MKILRPLLLLILTAGLTWQCATENEGLTINGKIEGAGNLQVFLDQVILGRANNVIGREEIAGNGTFSLNFPEGLEPGIYMLRIGAKRFALILEGDEKKIRIEGNLSTMDKYDLQIQGAPRSGQMAGILNEYTSRQVRSEEIATLVDTTGSPLLGAYIAYYALGSNGAFLPIQQNALRRLQETYPGTDLVNSYSEYLTAFNLRYQEQMARDRIQVGKPAPDITLPDPNGNMRSLSDLRGKVVLLDFWAAWCMPCRRENPNVVAVYNKYKDQGFDVFSVSLDGVDSRTMARLTDQAQVNQLTERHRNNWLQAIRDDKLTWENHVSDLRYFETEPARIYGVNGIPRAFMIDRDGIIVSTSVRGARAIEATLLQHL